MTTDDLAAVVALADRIHVDFPEDLDVLAEKLALFRRGCFVLSVGQKDILGYCLSHPWTGSMPPTLNRLLRHLPGNPTTYFIHDVVLSETARGEGWVSRLLPKLVDIATGLGLTRLTLIAVGGSLAFWRRQGFSVTEDPALQAATRDKYGSAAVHMEKAVAPRRSSTPTSP